MTADLIFRLLLLAVFMALVAHRAYYTRKLGSVPEDPDRPKGGQRIAGLMAFAGLISTVLYIAYPPAMSWAALPLPDWLRWTAVGLAVLGFALLQWSQSTLGRNWSDEPGIRSEQSLVTSGPNKRIRHPIYTSFLLIMFSTGLISANWFIGLMWTGMTAIDVEGRMSYEEKIMAEEFGESYESYMRHTGRLMPRVGS